MYHRKRPATLLAATALVLAGCAATDAEVPAQTPAGSGHGAIEGAAEVAEPQLHLVAIDAAGKASMLDLLEGTETELDPVQPATDVTSDGRYVFAADESGVSIIDSGVWTWDHVDHFHYYRTEPRTLPRVSGEGVATISTGPLATAGTTGVFFPTSGEAVLLDNKALSEGRITEALRLDVDPHAGLIAPLGKGAVVSRGTSLDAVDLDGKVLESIDCAEPSGTITTRVGLAIGCADGAVLATANGEKAEFDRIPYPSGSASPITSFAARKGRPTVAGVGDGKGIWMLDTRERSWQWLETSTPVVTAAAVDDAEQHVVAVGRDGTVQVYDAESGEQTAATEAILSNPETADLTVDAQRAYVNDAEKGVVYEIDYADNARIARTLELATTPTHLAETGR